MSRRVTYEIKLTPRRRASGATELIAEVLMGIGLLPSQVVEQDDRGRRSVSVYAERAARARSLMRQIQAAGLRGVAMRLVAVRESEWQEKWKRHLRPFAITRRIRLVPSWSKEAKQGPGPNRIVLQTGLAFGTGKHPTTKTLAEFVELLRGKFKSVLDIGLGTGILAVVAYRCGAEHIVGIDIDRECVEVSDMNLAANGCRHYDLKLDDFAAAKIKTQFDLVVANLTTDDLIRMRRKIIAAVAPGCYLAVSGISADNTARFRRGFETPALRCLRLTTTHHWTAALYQRRNSR